MTMASKQRFVRSPEPCRGGVSLVAQLRQDLTLRVALLIEKVYIEKDGPRS